MSISGLVAERRAVRPIELSRSSTVGRAQRPLTRLLRGRPEDPAWVRPSLVLLLAGTAVLYLVSLGASGFANTFYAAAVEAGTRSWKAMLFGSFDPGNLLTVDKPPAALWVMEVPARLFGVNPWTILVPQALEGVASVGVPYLTVRRVGSAGAGLLAGLLLAITPVAVLMFRFDNPDALLVLLLVAVAYTTVRALETGGSHWLALCGALLGMAFLTKMIQGLVVVPVLAGVYLVAGPHSAGRRLRQLVIGGLALAATGGWWVALVQLTPASARPFIGSTQDNSLVDLILGYNGFGRLTGAESGLPSAPASSAGGGNPGWTRMFNAEFGTQIAWLLPAALLAVVVGLVISRRRRRTDPWRAAVLLFGGWLIVTGGLFSVGGGIIHTYYSVALAPAVAALVALVAAELWAYRSARWARWCLGIGVWGTMVWGWVLATGRDPLLPALIGAVVAAGLVRRRAGARWAILGLLLCSAWPLAFSVVTASTAQKTSVPVAGSDHPYPHQPDVLLRVDLPSTAQVRYVEAGSPRATWLVATVGADPAAGYQLATGRPAMALGGFNGTDPVPTLEAFAADVRTGRVSWFVDDTPRAHSVGGPLGADTVAIVRWVEQHFPGKQVNGTTIFDLQRPPLSPSTTTGR